MLSLRETSRASPASLTFKRTILHLSTTDEHGMPSRAGPRQHRKVALELHSLGPTFHHADASISRLTFALHVSLASDAQHTAQQRLAQRCISTICDVRQDGMYEFHKVYRRIRFTHQPIFEKSGRASCRGRASYTSSKEETRETEEGTGREGGGEEGEVGRWARWEGEHALKFEGKRGIGVISFITSVKSFFEDLFVASRRGARERSRTGTGIIYGKSLTKG